VPYSAALDGNFFSFLARVHPTGKHSPIFRCCLGALTFAFSLLFKLKTVDHAVLAMRLIIQSLASRGCYFCGGRCPERCP